jgi:hypothetical protein
MDQLQTLLNAQNVQTATPVLQNLDTDYNMFDDLYADDYLNLDYDLGYDDLDYGYGYDDLMNLDYDYGYGDDLMNLDYDYGFDASDDFDLNTMSAQELLNMLSDTY